MFGRGGRWGQVGRLGKVTVDLEAKEERLRECGEDVHPAG